LEGDVVPLDWSPDAKRVLLCQYTRATQRLYIYNLADDTLMRLDHPAGSFGVMAGLAGLVQEAYFGTSGELLAHWQDSTRPARLIALDGETGALTRTVLAACQVPSCHPWQSVTFSSSDGQAIQGWLALPDGERPFPAILHTHGGPGAVATECFSPESQAWLDHGFAYLTINYRSSTTFGRAFQEQIWGNPGKWEVEDMVAARDWLVRAGIAWPDQILLTGSSYGGYLTLLALGKRPDLWVGGIASVAIADWAVQYQDATDEGKRRMEALFDGTPTERPEAYAASSPMTYVERIQAPVLIIQARHDTRAPARQIVLYEEKMKALGKSIEVRWFEAGHLGRAAQVERSIEDQVLALHFARRILSQIPTVERQHPTCSNFAPRE
jgi:dipeptidyl aminopeptidase/acylaminoacyl peptidase